MSFLHRKSPKISVNLLELFSAEFRGGAEGGALPYKNLKSRTARPPDALTFMRTVYYPPAAPNAFLIHNKCIFFPSALDFIGKVHYNECDEEPPVYPKHPRTTSERKGFLT